jgi:hypothetical protein
MFASAAGGNRVLDSAIHRKNPGDTRRLRAFPVDSNLFLMEDETKSV